MVWEHFLMAFFLCLGPCSGGHWPHTRDASVQSQASPRGICGVQNDIGTGFSPSTSVFPLVSLHQRSILIQMDVTDLYSFIIC